MENPLYEHARAATEEVAGTVLGVASAAVEQVPYQRALRVARRIRGAAGSPREEAAAARAASLVDRARSTTHHTMKLLGY